MSNSKKCEGNNEVALINSNDMTLNFPEASPHITKEGGKTREIIKENGYADPNTGETFIDKTALPHLLVTDKAGVNKFYNGLNNDEKRENGNNKLVSVPAIQKEVAKRIEEPRDTLEKERLRDTEKCLIVLRDSPEIEKERELVESKNRKNLKKFKEKIIKENNITNDECTGEPLSSPHAHHIERQADNPRKALDSKNIAIVNPDTHQDIHSKKIHNKEELLDYAEKNGGNLGNRIKNK